MALPEFVEGAIQTRQTGLRIEFSEPGAGWWRPHRHKRPTAPHRLDVNQTAGHASAGPGATVDAGRGDRDTEPAQQPGGRRAVHALRRRVNSQTAKRYGNRTATDRDGFRCARCARSGEVVDPGGGVGRRSRFGDDPSCSNRSASSRPTPGTAWNGPLSTWPTDARTFHFRWVWIAARAGQPTRVRGSDVPAG